MSISLSPARAAASRRNGARSQGPRTPEGKARSAQNALKHGLCAQKFPVLDDEDAQAFAALEAAIFEELAPEGVVQRLLAGRIVRAAWRLERAERIENELLEYRKGGDGDLALALIRDGNGTRSIETLMRYRGSAQAEFYRALRTLKALQAEAASLAQPNRPETRENPGLPREPAPAPADADSRQPRRSLGHPMPQPAAAMRERAASPARPRLPDEPESRAHPGEISGWRGPTSRHAG